MILLERIRHLKDLEKAKLPLEEYVLVNSAWLALMGIRRNGDLDLIISSTLWESRFANYPSDQSFGLPGPNSKRIRIHPLKNGNYLTMTDLRTNDCAIYKHKIMVDGIPLIEPRYYFQYLAARHKKFMKKFEGLSWWQRLAFINPSYKKLKQKLYKDNYSISEIKKYFSHETPKEGPLKNISQHQWGLHDPNLKVFFRP